MQRSLIQSWCRDVPDGATPDRLRLDAELQLDDAGLPSVWKLTAKLERTADQPYVREAIALRGSLEICHVFRNHISLSGRLDVVCSEDAIIIWGQLTYGFDQDPPHYFQGSLAEWLTTEPPVPPPLPPPDDDPPELPAAPLPVDPTEPPIIAEAATVAEHGELFPYTYLRSWPEPANSQLDACFVGYPRPLDAPPTGELLTQLAALRAQGGPDARGAMQAAAASYIDGQPETAEPFLEHPDRLDGPIAAYGRIYRLIKSRHGSIDDIAAEIWALLGMTVDETRRYLASDAHAEDMIRIWQSYLALVIALGFDRRARTRLVHWLIVEHVLGWLVDAGTTADLAGLTARARAVVALPVPIFPLPPGAPETSPPSGPEVIVPYAIGDLLMVNHSLRGYALGELAYVESVAAGERRRSTQRQLDRTIESTVHSRAAAADHEQTARSASSSLASEVIGTLADSVVTTTYNDFGTSYGPPTTATLSGGWTAEHKPAGNPSKEDLTRFARQVLSRTVHRIAHQVAELRSRSTQRDSETTVTRVIDNSTGARNRRALYWWLDEVHAARVVNYGTRLLVEMIVPAPAAQLIQRERSAGAGHREPPVPPAALGIESFEDITPHNFALLAARYPADDLELPPPERRVVSVSVRGGEPCPVELPSGYRAVSASLAYTVSPGAALALIEGVIGRRSIQVTAAQSGVEHLDLDGEDGVVQVIVAATAHSSPPDDAELLLALELETAPTDRTMDAWRLRTFQAIQRSYAAQRRDYDGALAPGGTRPQEVRPRVSARAVERRELRHGAIELLFARLHHLVGERPDPGQPISELELARPRYLRFFDSAFEWREMTYSFTSAPGGDPAAAALAPRFTDDGRFAEFLEAAYARLLVPVSLAHAPAVLFFLASGGLWDDADGWASHVAAHPTDVALVSELLAVTTPGTPDAPDAHDTPRVVRELAAIRVPTNIAVLADGDLTLVDSSNPCAGAIP